MNCGLGHRRLVGEIERRPETQVEKLKGPGGRANQACFLVLFHNDAPGPYKKTLTESTDSWEWCRSFAQKEHRARKKHNVFLIFLRM